MEQHVIGRCHCFWGWQTSTGPARADQQAISAPCHAFCQIDQLVNSAFFENWVLIRWYVHLVVDLDDDVRETLLQNTFSGVGFGGQRRR